MKTNMLKLTAIMLILVGSLSSCGDDDSNCKEIINLPQEKVCNAENPLTDLPWLKEEIAISKKNSISFAIFLCSYNGGTGFLLYYGCPPNVYCIAGPSYVFKNCEGETLCITYNPNLSDCHEELDIDVENKTLIYELTCPFLMK